MPIYFWAVVMAFVLNKIWRRHRLAQHGLDPNLVDLANRERNARLHEDYARRFGPPSRIGEVAVQLKSVLILRRAARRA